MFDANQIQIISVIVPWDFGMSQVHSGIMALEDTGAQYAALCVFFPLITIKNVISINCKFVDTISPVSEVVLQPFSILIYKPEMNARGGDTRIKRHSLFSFSHVFLSSDFSVFCHKSTI